MFDEADNDWDCAFEGDIALSAPPGAEPEITLIAKTHFLIPAGQRGAARSAALTSQAAFDSWVAGSSIPQPVKTWYSGLASDIKATFCRAAKCI